MGSHHFPKVTFCHQIDFESAQTWPVGQKRSKLLKNNQFAESKEELLQTLAYQYDLVCDGIELASGAIRNHMNELLVKAFEVVGYDPKDVAKNFEAMINAFKMGIPPHGGIAFGMERILMLLANKESIREVIAFPTNNQAQDLMMNAPSEISNEQLKELNLSLKKKFYYKFFIVRASA